MSSPKSAIGIPSRGIRRIEHLSAFLGEEVAAVHPLGVTWRQLSGVAGWGRRPSALRAQAFAKARGIHRYLCLEDGFLRSVHPGAQYRTCSLVVDDLGIYYDASTPSRLEALVRTPLSREQQERTRHLIEHWRDAGVSKYNHAPDSTALPSGKYVLVVDQTVGDASVHHGQADAASFRRMLDAALQSYPACRVLVKEHPEVASGRKRGYLGQILDAGDYPQVIRLRDDVHVVPLLRHAEAVFAVTSQVGFEALMHGRRVHTFGMPFYAGWGLTCDEVTAPSRRMTVPLEQLVHAALIGYTRYVSPQTGQRCEVEEAISHLALQRRMRLQLPGHVHAVGFSRWKRPFLRQFLQGCVIQFHGKLDRVPRNAVVLQWGRKGHAADRPDLSVIAVEDGFLRSVGLGAQLVRPVSWVFDRRGIYYDATRPSDLECLLNDAEFDRPTLARAEALREAIAHSGITKYNVGNGIWKRPTTAHRVVLVIGQVETDASLRFGAPGITTNRALLEAVRQREPQAYILYKPHPDVMAGLRGSRAAESGLGELCDELVPGYPIHQLIEAVDCVHVLTSLAGFEALLRGTPVTTHGLPFYAGWGLTEDVCRTSRRQRTLTLDMLVAGALILYPRYILRNVAEGLASPEQAVAELKAWRAEAPPIQRGLLRKIMQPFLRYWARPAPMESVVSSGRQGDG